jgi:predicted transcriptional regulator
MKKLVVDNVMSQPVYEVSQDDTVEVALQKMKEKGVKKILVKSGDTPLGVLEEWKITDSDLRLRVNQMKLGECKVVPRGTDIQEVEKTLVNYSAVYVSEPDNPKKLVGVVTAYDLVKAY